MVLPKEESSTRVALRITEEEVLMFPRDLKASRATNTATTSRNKIKRQDNQMSKEMIMANQLISKTWPKRETQDSSRTLAVQLEVALT